LPVEAFRPTFRLRDGDRGKERARDDVD